MLPQDDWLQVLRRLEAVEKLVMELLQRVQRLELQVGVKPTVLPREPKGKPEVTAMPEPTEPKIPTPEISVEPEEPKRPKPQILREVMKPSVEPPIQPKPQPIPPSRQPVTEQPQKPLSEQPEKPSPKPSRPAFELEMLLGGKVALWVGAILVLLAATFGLAYSWQFIGPTGRVVVGILAGLTFIASGEFARGRTTKWFVEGITALGLALLYLTIWAAAMRYRIVEFPLAFSAMAIVTASGVAFSVRHDALSLMLFATLGGFLTPVLLRSEATGINQTLPFFAYITLLNAGVLATATYKRWQVINFVALFATLLIVSGWALLNYEPALRWQTFAFATVNFLIFVSIGIAYPLRFRERSEPLDLVFLLAVTGIYFVVGAWLLWEPLTAIRMPKPLAFMRGALGIFPLMLAAFWAILGEMVKARVPNDKALIVTSYGLAVGFLTIAVPMQFRGNPIAMVWAVEAAVLTTVALRVSQERAPTEFLSDMAQLIWLLALALGLWLDLTETEIEWRPIFNERFATFAALIGSSAFIAREYWLRAKEVTSELAAFVAAGLVFWLIARETVAWFEWAGWFVEHRSEAAWLTVFGLWSLVAIAILSVGLKPNVPLGSAQILGTIALTIAAFGAFFVSLSVVTADWLLVFNPRFVNLLLLAVALGVVARALMRSTDRGELLTPSIFAFASFVLSITAFSEEIYAGFWRLKVPSEATWETAAWLCVFGFWGVSALVGWLAGLRWRLTVLRNASLAIWATASLGALSVSFSPDISEWRPFLNFRAASFLVLIASGFSLAFAIERNQGRLTKGEQELLLPTFFGAATNFLALWTLTQETHFLFRKTQFPSPETWRYAAQGAISVVWAIYAAVAMAVGIVKRWSGARWLGLILLCLAVLKVFFVDLGFLTLPYRMLSFGVLGLILLGVAWAYSKYGELIRQWASPKTE